MKRQPEDEINFRELFKDPIRLFGWVFPYILLLLLLLGVFYVNRISQVSFNEQSLGVPDTTNMKKEIPMKKGGVIAAVDLNLVQAPSSEFIAKGKVLFNTNCKSCHGEKGLGDGPAGAKLNPQPRNFHVTTG